MSGLQHCRVVLKICMRVQIYRDDVCTHGVHALTIKATRTYVRSHFITGPQDLRYNNVHSVEILPTNTKYCPS